MKSALDFVHSLIPDKLDISIDATLGRGKDALILAKRSRLLIGFELQKEAYDRSRKLLEGYNTRLYNCCHSEMGDLVDERVDLVIFNLGYLPGGNKEFSTQASTTKKAILASLKLLVSGGRVLIVAYGHSQGQEEIQMLKDLEIDQGYADVFRLVHHNGTNRPPEAWIIIKK